MHPNSARFVIFCSSFHSAAFKSEAYLFCLYQGKQTLDVSKMDLKLPIKQTKNKDNSKYCKQSLKFMYVCHTLIF